MGTMQKLRQRVSEGASRADLLAEGFTPSSITNATKQFKAREPKCTPRQAASNPATPAVITSEDSLVSLRPDVERRKLENQLLAEEASAAKLASPQPVVEARLPRITHSFCALDKAG